MFAYVPGSVCVCVCVCARVRKWCLSIGHGPGPKMGQDFPIRHWQFRSHAAPSGTGQTYIDTCVRERNEESPSFSLENFHSVCHTQPNFERGLPVSYLGRAASGTAARHSQSARVHTARRTVNLVQTYFFPIIQVEPALFLMDTVALFRVCSTGLRQT